MARLINSEHVVLRVVVQRIPRGVEEVPQPALEVREVYLDAAVATLCDAVELHAARRLRGIFTRLSVDVPDHLHEARRRLGEFVHAEGAPDVHLH